MPAGQGFTNVIWDIWLAGVPVVVLALTVVLAIPVVLAVVLAVVQFKVISKNY